MGDPVSDQIERRESSSVFGAPVEDAHRHAIVTVTVPVAALAVAAFDDDGDVGRAAQQRLKQGDRGDAIRAHHDDRRVGQ